MLSTLFLGVCLVAGDRLRAGARRHAPPPPDIFYI